MNANLKKAIKESIQSLPPFIGKPLSHIPFKYRLGKAYSTYKESINFEKPPKSKILELFQGLVQYAESNIPFYHSFYKEQGFSSSMLCTYADIQKIPIITKAVLQKWELSERTIGENKGIRTNTGGTSGQPLALLHDSNSYAREWAHMHSIWEKLEYKPSALKLTIRGMNLGSSPIKYNFLQNEYRVNAYCKFEDIVTSLSKIIKKEKIEYIHGYPSGIYEFTKSLAKLAPEVSNELKKTLKGVFLGSEYPAPIYRDEIEKTWGVPTISWYGHTEMAVLAYERNEKFVYYPFQGSYGFAESIRLDGCDHLIGTTLHNEVGPLIRYDTGDIITPISFKHDMLESFKIEAGRIGDFVIDKNDRSISLTALVFGRHHKIFEYADFIQVKQIEKGKMVVLVSTNNTQLQCKELFDTKGIEMDITFQIIDKPIKTKSGKVSLLIK